MKGFAYQSHLAVVLPLLAQHLLEVVFVWRRPNVVEQLLQAIVLVPVTSNVVLVHLRLVQLQSAAEHAPVSLPALHLAVFPSQKIALIHQITNVVSTEPTATAMARASISAALSLLRRLPALFPTAIRISSLEATSLLVTWTLKSANL